MRIRPATAGDVPAITELYNALIPTTTVAWTEEPDSVDSRSQWFHDQIAADRPVLVAEIDDVVVGFTTYTWFRGEGRWPGYRHTVEHTIHVAEAAWGQGVGRALLESLMVEAAERGVHVMVGAVDADNVESIRFHERLGFVETARMPEVGRKFDRWLDLVLMQRVLD